MEVSNWDGSLETTERHVIAGDGGTVLLGWAWVLLLWMASVCCSVYFVLAFSVWANDWMDIEQALNDQFDVNPWTHFVALFMCAVRCRRCSCREVLLLTLRRVRVVWGWGIAFFLECGMSSSSCDGAMDPWGSNNIRGRNAVVWEEGGWWHLCFGWYLV